MHTRTTRPCSGLLTLALLLTLLAPGALLAQVQPEKLPAVAERAHRHADLDIPAFNLEVRQLQPATANGVRQRLGRLGVNEATARVDKRSGNFVTLMPATPLLPGTGVGNHLTWDDKVAAPEGPAARERAAWEAFLGYLRAHRDDLGVDPGELSTHRVASHGGGDLYQVHVERAFDGIPVRGSHVSAAIGQGNLTLMSIHQWGRRPAASHRPEITADEALLAAETYLAPLRVTREWGKAGRVYLPMAVGRGQSDVAHGRGYRYQLAWAVKVQVDGDGGSWEVLVDAYNGEILANEDRNHYAEAKGGVYPVTNDGINPDGVEQPGWPMPFMEVGSAITDTGGNYNLSGSQTARLYGPYVNMADNCGTDSLTQSGGIDWGTSGGDDCTTPGFGGAGNTHASRSGFYELNRSKEMARSQLPSNSWLQARLTSNMNINNTCNAYWGGGTVNFYRSGDGCFNTGEIAGVFVHEWGHGLDDNDVNGSIASPSGEGIADIYTALRLDTSCIGRNFRSTVCTGFGDPCNTCTGVRDIDYLKRQSGNPHDYSWSNANCGGSVHCVGAVYAEAVYSLWKRKLQSAPYNYDNNTAHEITNRLTYIGAGATGTWFSGGPPNGGCSGSSGYNNYLAADDDNGNLNDGTPHMTAIYDAFNDQEIACQTPAVQDSGCAGTPTAALNVTATPGNTSVDLSWNTVLGASGYEVFRAEGIFQCNFGKVKIAETTGTSFSDTGLQNGRDYSYVVIPKGSNDACFGNASACDTVQPADGPECAVDGDCDDGLWCNGSETCNAGSCVAGSDPCPGQGCDEGGDICTDTNGPQNAVYDSGLGAPACAVAGSSCDSLALLDGRAGLGPEPNQPNTVDSCTDGTSGTYHSDESNDKLVVSTLDSNDFSEGATVQVDATVYGWSTGTSDHLDLYYAADATSPSWTHITTIDLTAGGVQTLSAQYTLPAGSLQAVRANFRYNGSQSSCGTGSYDDTDDLVFAVGGGAPECVVDADCSDGLWCNGGETCNAGSCQSGTAPACDDGLWCNGTETCNEGTDSCDNGTAPACDDGLWCNGAETCNEGTDSCDNGTAPACDDGLWCNGAETCNEGTDSCDNGTAPNCNDGVGCTDDSCNEGTDSCDNVANNALCPNDGAFCNGTEFCDPSLDCQSTGDPCSAGQTCNETADICEGSGGGPQDAIYDAGLGAPACAAVGSECDSLALVDGRGTVGPEANQPNTLDSCTDGSSGSYHSDESNDRLVVKTLDGADMAEGAVVQVDATVYAWSTGTSDHLDLYYAADANSPVWTLIGTFDPPAGGVQTLSAQYTLPAGSLQAVRANFRYNGSQSSCSGGSYDDADDLVFAVGGGAPECVVDADCDDGLYCNGSETCNAGSCQAGSDPCPGQSCDEGGDVCVPAGGCTVDDDFEAGAPDWFIDAASTCTTGDYVTGNPTNPGGGQQIVGSHSGVTSIFTAANTSAGVNDVDGGNCILGSPTWAVSNASTLSVWYWHGQRDSNDDAAGDFFLLEVSTNGGANWSTLASNGDSASTAAWTNATTSIPAGSNVELRVQCSDGTAGGDLIECGIDDVSICE